jgi:hypothetical protein
LFVTLTRKGGIKMDFRLMEQIVRSEQLTHEQVWDIFNDNPEFYEWYKQRI